MILKDKRIVLTGIASKRSIAWGIAQSLSEQGAKLVLTYPNDKIKKRVDMAAAEFSAEAVLELDVGQDGHFADLTRSLEAIWPEGIDGAVHAIGFAPADQLDGDFTSVTTREGFAIAHDISSYSFIALAKATEELLAKRAGSLLTLSYAGSERTYTNYNVMGLAKASLEASVRYMATDLGARGVRVNAISAGPIRTLAASGVSGFRQILDMNEAMSPLQRNVSIEEVGDAAAMLLSDLSRAITAQIIYVDGGVSTVGATSKVLSKFTD